MMASTLGMFSWKFALVLFGVSSTHFAPTRAFGQALTPDPSAWRPMSYSDLRYPSPSTATYADLWKDAIEKNNDDYRARGDTRFLNGNAPAAEAHFVIWSAKKSVVLSLLNTATGCSVKRSQPLVGATVKMCPVRIAVYEGIRVRTMDGGQLCFLEISRAVLDRNADPTNSAAYASYDAATKTVKTGLVIDHQSVDGCAANIPLQLH